MRCFSILLDVPRACLDFCDQLHLLGSIIIAEAIIQTGKSFHYGDKLANASSSLSEKPACNLASL